MTPRGLRNCNPLNLRATSGPPWVGQIGVDDAGFCIFDTMENGIRAGAKVLQAYQVKHGLTTLRQMIARFAPPSENDTDAYLDHVCHFCCANPDNAYTLTPPRMLSLVSAIIKHENGVTLPIATVQAGVDLAYQ